MFKTVSKAVFALIATTNAANPTNPGVSGSISQAGLDNAKNVAAPIIFSQLKDVKIPEIDIKDGSFKNLEIHIPMPDQSDVSVVADSAKNGIELKAEKVALTIHSDFTFKYFITVSGVADISISGISVDIEAGLGTQPGTPTSELAPMLTIVKNAININPDNVDIKLSGGLVSKIANVLIPLIKSSLIPQIVSTVESTISDLVSKTVNPDL